MKDASGAILTHLSQECTTLCTCWRIDRTDGVSLGFTDHDQNVHVAGIDYEASTGYARSAIKASGDLAVDNLDVQGIESLVQGEGITHEDIRRGLYDSAEVTIFQVNYLAPADGQITLRKGTIGEFKLRDGVYTTEIRGLTQRLSQQFVEVITPDCLASLGDARCKVDLAALTHEGYVSAVDETEPRRIMSVIVPLMDTGYFVGGVITFTSGNNAGHSMEVQAHEAPVFHLYLDLPFPAEIGDEFTVQAGCDRAYETCRTRFNNLVNFRGFPHLPGRDKLLEYPDAHF